MVALAKLLLHSKYREYHAPKTNASANTSQPARDGSSAASRNPKPAILKIVLVFVTVVPARIFSKMVQHLGIRLGSILLGSPSF